PACCPLSNVLLSFHSSSPSSHPCSSFSMHRPPPHRVPHSFPTRRSSDLDAPPRFRARRRPVDPADPVPPRRGVPSGEAPRRNPRSEEHTSELQSRFDLVCRLLLEKKKKQQT